MRQGSTLTFSELASQVESIQIPILQRDYAQGRKEAEEVRRQFLAAIKQALLEPDLEQPLDLDFVYGNFEGSSQASFSVLDGQQRLTTLFLLHWYLAAKEGNLEAFRESFVSGTRSKFTYKTRVSASEFFDALATADDVSLDGVQGKLSNVIIDKQWFFLSWKADPTVQACLRMLDSLHEQFVACDGGLYVRLTDAQSPRLVFQYLNLESFGLSDELYIKMNARGKPLTDFENFKAWLCGQLEEMPEGKEIERKIDQEWTDIFWQLSRELDGNFDKLYLRFFNLMAFYSACERVEGSYDLLDNSWKSWLRRLRVSDSYVPTDELKKFESFDEKTIASTVVVLDYFHAHLATPEVSCILREAVTSDDYVTQTKFYAYIKFIQSVGKSATWGQDIDMQLSRWKRVTGNLIHNHRIDELSPFIPALRGIAELSAHSQELYEYLVETGMESGFAKDQRDEEALKARLILQDASWEVLLTQYESHPYLQGKVGFLLGMATNERDETVDQSRFATLAAKAAVVLSDEILRSSDFLVERALLSLGDYLVPQGSYRYSFCMPDRGTFRDRSENWLKVVNKPVFKNLLNALQGDVKAALRQLVTNVDCGGWRQLIVENPEVIRYCSARLIYRDGESVYLLSKSTFRGYHAELRTYVFELKLRNLEKRGALPNQISDFGYTEVYGTDEIGYVWVELSDEEAYYVDFDDGLFRCWIDGEEDSSEEFLEVDMPSMLKNLLLEIFPGEVEQ